MAKHFLNEFVLFLESLQEGDYFRNPFVAGFLCGIHPAPRSIGAVEPRGYVLPNGGRNVCREAHARAFRICFTSADFFMPPASIIAAVA